jgi:hypothetical protein
LNPKANQISEEEKLKRFIDTLFKWAKGEEAVLLTEKMGEQLRAQAFGEIEQ